jgi:hypothetical protein
MVLRLRCCVPSNRRPSDITQETKELEILVDRYLDLADRATGFRRHSLPNNLTVSTCNRCQRIAAALQITLLAFVESLHVCPDSKSSPRPSNGR